jgi:hypothetical protein
MDEFNFRLFVDDRLRFSKSAGVTGISEFWDSYLSWGSYRKIHDPTYKRMSKKKFIKRMIKLDSLYFTENNTINWHCFKTNEEAEEYDDAFDNLNRLRRDLRDLIEP